MMILQYVEFVCECFEVMLVDDLFEMIFVGYLMGGVIGQYLCEGEVDSEIKFVDCFVNVEGNFLLLDCMLSVKVVSQLFEVWCCLG